MAAPASAADEDLPGRVGRVADVSGELLLAPQDQPEQWTPVGLNYPVAAGDNVWVGPDGRAEIDIGAAQFRLLGNTSMLLSRLDDRQFALFIAQGKVSLRVRVLDPGETAQIDTPNAQIVLTRPGLYRIEVGDDREHTSVVVREGEINIQTGGAVTQVLPGQAAMVDGAQPTFAAVTNGVGNDAFDGWIAGRERYYDRGRANSYVSRQMVGWADLEEYGTWDQSQQYGAVWYPSGVASDWAPYQNGYWTDVGGFGPTWVDYAPWGYAPFHYGRWAYVNNRWGWCPGAYVVRPQWAPALVAWTGGPGWAISTSYGAPVYGWVPLGWGEPYRPAWGRCSQGCWDRYNRPYAVPGGRYNTPPGRYVNASVPGGLSAMAAPALRARTPVRGNMVNVPGGMAAGAPLLAGAPVIRPEPGRIPGRQPGNGVPPPASTFYPTLARPGGVGLVNGAPSSGAMPNRGNTTAMQPSGLPGAAAPSGAGMTGIPRNVPGGPTGAGTVTGRPSPSAVPGATTGMGSVPTTGTAYPVPPAGLNARPVTRAPTAMPSVPTYNATPQVYGSPAPAQPTPSVARQPAQSQGIRMPSSMNPVPSQPMQSAPVNRPPPQQPMQQPIQIRPAPSAPLQVPVAPAPRPANVAPAPAPAPAQVAPAPAPSGGNGGQNRSRGMPPGPDTPR